MMLCDTNILVYAIDSESPFHHTAFQFIQENFPAKLFFTPQIFLEFFNIVTKRKGMTISPKETIEIINQFSQEENIVLPKNNTYLKALELCVKKQKSGAIIFDAYLIATALDNDIHIIATANTSDFIIFPDITILNPFLPTGIAKSEQEYIRGKGKKLKSLKDLRH